ncbi:glycoside hydrolase family 2 TIM barrel-domain containing protein [Litorihabitans aurantiacus]|uniref:beta-galactosidase n=1 Tax=Litorihabitans aurantiacus TaxID=1930061 RepID=A0AA38CV23_9MICO|nr:glycoside hydrolase family 2 TIM barrel-domain containing protein [Litorihabitans aurantiacus]GMA33144.1 beta-galactosidase [Litorihabitans aurantiacus]
MRSTVTHETVAPPTGTLPPRFRPASGASSATAIALDGQWRFRLFDHPDTGVARDDDGATWDAVTVPGHWQLAGAPTAWPYGTPAYTNKLFPFQVDPPFVPDENPTGEYRLSFEAPADWPSDGRTLLRFEGVDSWFEVALNGEVVAVSHGSRLPTEIDLTGRLRPGANLLAVRVTQWSAMTYVEDQDQWWLSGIFRSVTLEHRPDGGLDQVGVVADYDPATGEGTLTVDAGTLAGTAIDPSQVRVRIAELDVDTDAQAPVRAAVEPWSAEVPRLYRAEISTGAETVRLDVGFRRVSISDGVFLVNGRPVKLRGVNRHEFEPLRGRAVTRETMLADVLLMKAHHVNAVRTSHSPPHPHFLDLCDAYGLYVIDESDLETHGFENVDFVGEPVVDPPWTGNPVADPAWTEVLLDRVTRMVRRDAHHPSIVLWSLGNEAGRGLNVAAMAARVRELDPTRPIHYEGDYSSDDVDVYSRMYAESEETELIGLGTEAPLARADLDARRRGMPFLQCEYAHAMGNGPGGLADYDAIFDAHPRLMGGFIWEWIDHGLLRTDEQGREFHAYGGDFGETFHNSTFIADGLLLPDRTPSPSLIETAAVFSPVRLDPTGDGALLVRNRYAFRDTAHLSFDWSVHTGAEVLATGELAVALGAGESVRLAPSDVDLPALPEAPGSPVWWTVTARWREARGLEREWLSDGAAIASGQVLLAQPAPLPAPTGRAAIAQDGSYAVGGARLDRRGRLQHLLGLDVREMRPDAWRAPTDNDRRPPMWREMADADRWRTVGLHLLVERTVEAGLDGDAVRVVTRTGGPTTAAGFRTTYRWQPVEGADGADAVDLHVEIEPEGRWPQSVARLGLRLALDVRPELDAAVRWHGQGPEESYADSDRAARGGVWERTLGELQTRYTHPQENGARRGVTRAEIDLPGGPLRIEADDVVRGGRPQLGIELTARPWSDAALEHAAHPHELEADGLLWLHLDVAQHGLGSAACGPGVLPNAQLHATPVSMRLRFSRP